MDIYLKKKILETIFIFNMKNSFISLCTFIHLKFLSICTLCTYLLYWASYLICYIRFSGESRFNFLVSPDLWSPCTLTGTPCHAREIIFCFVMKDWTLRVGDPLSLFYTRIYVMYRNSRIFYNFLNEFEFSFFMIEKFSKF